MAPGYPARVKCVMAGSGVVSALRSKLVSIVSRLAVLGGVVALFRFLQGRLVCSDAEGTQTPF